MRTSKEIRALARKTLFHTRCGARAMSAMLLLGLACSLALLLLQQAFLTFGIRTLDYLALTGDAPLAAYSFDVLFAAAVATVFYVFIQAVFGGIQNFGWSLAALRGMRQAETGLTRAAFSGFHTPFGMFAMMFAYTIRLLVAALPLMLVYGIFFLAFYFLRDFLLAHTLWLGAGVFLLFIAFLVATIPVFYVIYRYRFVWYLKVDHPDWSATKCFRESARRLDGYKWRAFYLDCSYWKAFLLLTALLVAGLIPVLPELLRAMLVGIVFPVAAFFVSVYYMFGQAQFYLEVPPRAA